MGFSLVARDNGRLFVPGKTVKYDTRIQPGNTYLYKQDSPQDSPAFINVRKPLTEKFKIKSRDEIISLLKSILTKKSPQQKAQVIQQVSPILSPTNIPPKQFIEQILPLPEEQQLQVVNSVANDIVESPHATGGFFSMIKQLFANLSISADENILTSLEIEELSPTPEELTPEELSPIKEESPEIKEELSPIKEESPEINETPLEPASPELMDIPEETAQEVAIQLSQPIIPTISGVNIIQPQRAASTNLFSGLQDSMRNLGSSLGAMVSNMRTPLAPRSTPPEMTQTRSANVPLTVEVQTPWYSVLQDPDFLVTSPLSSEATAANYSPPQSRLSPAFRPAHWNNVDETPLSPSETVFGTIF